MTTTALVHYEAIPVGLGDVSSAAGPSASSGTSTTAPNAATPVTSSAYTLTIPAQITLQAAGAVALGSLLLGLVIGRMSAGHDEPLATRTPRRS